MRYIAHSVRTAAEVKQLPAWFGMHLEVRDRGSRLIVQPEPFRDGEDLEQLLAEYRHNMLFVQLNSEGIVSHVIKLLDLFGVENYALLGCSPAARAWLNEHEERRAAVRVSANEPAGWAVSQAGQAEWVWIDDLAGRDLPHATHAELRQRFRLCVASPETFGGRPQQIADFARKWHSLPVDAVCTARPDLWQAALSQLAAEDAANDLADQESLLSLLRQAA